MVTSSEPDPASAAPFPRERLSELLGEAEAVRARRERLQGWLIGIGLAILVLGLPSERLWGDMSLVRMTAGSGETSTGVLFPLAALMVRVTGVAPEKACFLLSALAYGLLFPATMRLMRTIGFEHGPGLAAACVALLAPAAWIGAAQPGDFAAGALGATLLLNTLFRPRGRWRSGYQWRAVTLFFLAFLLRPENALLLPAVVWAVARQGGRARGPMAGVTLALVATFAIQILIAGRPGAFWDTLLAGRSPAWSALPVWLGYLTLGLGGAGLGLHGLLFDRRLPEETPPPVWMVPWCLVVLAPVAGGAPGWGPVGGFLLPAAAVGLADWLTRRERGDLARRWAVGLVAVQLLAAAGVRAAWELGDPLAQLRGQARALLQPADVVWTSDPALAYLSTQRWGLDAVGAPGELDPQTTRRIERGERRLIVLRAPEPGTRATVPAQVLVDGVLVEWPAGVPWAQ